MREQRESRVVWVLAGISMFLIFSLFSIQEVYVSETYGDMSFLYNRCYQMWDCVKHGFYPFLYYNDAGGIGYGSPIFYGQLSLVPFIPFLGSIATFTKVYMLVCMVLNFFGMRCFLKRFSNYATLVSVFYIISPIYLFFWRGTLLANIMGVGWSWFFLAFCVDYFRDGRNFWSLTLTYFMIWQTNLLSAVFAFAVCVGLFVVYFDCKRLKDYLRLFVCVALLLSYNIANILMHLDSMHSADFSAAFAEIRHDGSSRMCLSSMPFGGWLLRGILQADRCTSWASLGVVAVFVLFYWRGLCAESKRFRVCSIVCICVCAVAYIVGMCSVWPTLYSLCKPFFQWPNRYFILLFGLSLVILARVIKPCKLVYVVLVFSIVDIAICNPLSRVEPPASAVHLSPVFLQIGQGEYCSEEFDFSPDIYYDYGFSVHASSGIEYSYTNEYNGVSVDCSANEGNEVLTLPKLYYNGYQAVGDCEERFAVTSGFSNYCEVAIGDYQGVVRLRYEVPVVIFALFILQVLLVLYYSWRCLNERRTAH